MIIGWIDEIRQYLDSRYIAPPEAAWRIFGFLLHEEYPPVVRLAVHLPGMHHVLFNPNEGAEVIQSRAAQQKSTLMGFFSCCESYPAARAYTYQEFPQYFVWHKTLKIWKVRQKGSAIGRMYFVSPNAGERFYLRLLLTVVRGPKSFECLRTFDGIIYDTFKQACVARGLLEDHGEWIQCLEEAARMNSGHQLRRLFCTLLLECHPLNPHLLWDRFAKDICDDLAHVLRTTRGVANPTEDQILDYELYLINELLVETGKNLNEHFPTMPQPREIWSEITDTCIMSDGEEMKTVVHARLSVCSTPTYVDRKRFTDMSYILA